MTIKATYRTEIDILQIFVKFTKLVIVKLIMIHPKREEAYYDFRNLHLSL